jgi:hypothetical protein
MDLPNLFGWEGAGQYVGGVHDGAWVATEQKKEVLDLLDYLGPDRSCHPIIWLYSRGHGTM